MAPSFVTAFVSKACAKIRTNFKIPNSPPIFCAKTVSKNAWRRCGGSRVRPERAAAGQFTPAIPRSVGRNFDRSAVVETDKAPAYGGGYPVVSCPDSGGLILQPENGFRSAEKPCLRRWGDNRSTCSVRAGSVRNRSFCTGLLKKCRKKEVVSG